MHHRVLFGVMAAFALMSGSRPVASPVPDERLGDVDILVEGVPQERFAHNGRWYVEAIKGREYAIRVRNPFGVRVAVALSVDGLNTIDARQTTASDARKWVIDPYDTVTIRGWQTSRSGARRFEFTTEEGSYGQALGKTANLGTISAVFFRERVRTVERDYRERARTAMASPPSPASPAAQEGAARADAQTKESEEYAATGMGRPTAHAVTQVWLDLENLPAQTVHIRYEFRPQLVRLGILPVDRVAHPLARRERGRGFEPGFSPVPHQD
jgi:hypothetical protein